MKRPWCEQDFRHTPNAATGLRLQRRPSDIDEGLNGAKTTGWNRSEYLGNSTNLPPPRQQAGGGNLKAES